MRLVIFVIPIILFSVQGQPGISQTGDDTSSPSSLPPPPPSTDDVEEQAPIGSLPSDFVRDINEEIAGIINFGNDLGRKVFPPDAYDFAEQAGSGLLFESIPIPLTDSEKQDLQEIIDECPVNPSKASGDFVTVQNGEFRFNGAKFQFVGFNSYQVVREQLSNPGGLDTLFRQARNLGLKVTRVWLFSDEIRTGPFEWDEAIFVALDNIIQKAQQYDIKIVFAFANYWEHFTGSEQYVYWSQGTLTDKTIEDFFLDYGTRLLYKAHVCKCVNRVNTVTVVRWRDDPTIFSWNLMNEPRCPGCTFGGSRSFATTEWIKEMSEFIKSIDPNHMVTTGMEGFSTDEAGSGHLNNPGSWALCQGTDFIKGHEFSTIDYATIHVYPEHNTWNWAEGKFCDAQCQIRWSQHYFESRINEATSILNKPLVLEEFGMSIKMRYRVSQADGGYFEQDYSRAERVDMYRAILGAQLSAVDRGEHADGVMFWMAITNSYPDYDGFSIELDDSVSFEGQNPPDYNVLQSFRKQNEVEQCVAEKANWRPNPVSPLPLSVTANGNNVNELVFDASEKLAGQDPTSPTPDPSSPPLSDACTDVAPDDRYTCAEQQEWGKCSEDWMVNNDFCKRTCGRCSDDPPPAPTPTPAPSPTPAPTSPPADSDCVDVAPDSVYTCQEQKDFGKCQESWMLNGDFCKVTCVRCLPRGCSDVAPDNQYSCQEQNEFGKCEESWMIAGGFCAQTCNRC